jgi:hypothetical protein
MGRIGMRKKNPSATPGEITEFIYEKEYISSIIDKFEEDYIDEFGTGPNSKALKILSRYLYRESRILLSKMKDRYPSSDMRRRWKGDY